MAKGCHLRSDSVPLRGGVVIRPCLDLGVEAVLVLVPKGRVAHQQDVQNHPCNVTMPPPLHTQPQFSNENSYFC